VVFRRKGKGKGLLINEKNEHKPFFLIPFWPSKAQWQLSPFPSLLTDEWDPVVSFILFSVNPHPRSIHRPCRGPVPMSRRTSTQEPADQPRTIPSSPLLLPCASQHVNTIREAGTQTPPTPLTRPHLAPTSPEARGQGRV